MLASAADSIALQNYRDALLNIRMIREAIERLGPPGALPSEEAVVKLYGPRLSMKRRLCRRAHKHPCGRPKA
jgi:hypothetical protein